MHTSCNILGSVHSGVSSFYKAIKRLVPILSFSYLGGRRTVECASEHGLQWKWTDDGRPVGQV
jgi:hypothetical protein